MTPAFPNPDPWDGDPAQIVEEARLLLRMDADDPDVSQRLMPLSYAVVELVRELLADPLPFDDVTQTEPIPETIHQACITALVEVYRRKDATFGITGAWSGDGINMRVSRDWLEGVLVALQPYRARFGVA